MAMSITSKIINCLPLLLAGGYSIVAIAVLIAACTTQHDGGAWVIHMCLSLPLSFLVSWLAKAVVPTVFLHEWPSPERPLLFLLDIFTTMFLGPIMYYYVGKGLRFLLSDSVPADKGHRKV